MRFRLTEGARCDTTLAVKLNGWILNLWWYSEVAVVEVARCRAEHEDIWVAWMELSVCNEVIRVWGFDDIMGSGCLVEVPEVDVMKVGGNKMFVVGAQTQVVDVILMAPFILAH